MNLSDILYGKKVMERLGRDNPEYSRKLALIMCVFFVAVAFLPVFIFVNFTRQFYLNAAMNVIAFAAILTGFIHMRRTASLQVAAHIYITILMAQFLLDFSTDTNRAMWSYSLPAMCFFLLGLNPALILLSTYFFVELVIMLLVLPERYPSDFKIRFPIVFFSISVFSYLFESVRQQTHARLEQSRAMLAVQRDIGIKLGSSGNISDALNGLLAQLVKIQPIDCGGIYLVEKNGGLKLHAHKGLPPGFLENVLYYDVDSPNTKFIMRGEPIFKGYDELAAEKSIILEKSSVKAVAVLPVKSEDRVIACLNLASTSSGSIPQSVAGALEAVANSLGNALSRLIAVEDLRELSSRNNAILGAVPDIIMEVNGDKVYTWANKAGYEFFGDDVIGREAAVYFEGEQETYDQVIQLFNGSTDLQYVESLQRRKDGEKRLLAWWCKSLRDSKGNVVGAISSARDITEMRRLEEQLRQSQKMDVIGQLAGGVAHDFNNQLTVISGFGELLRKKAGDDKLIAEFAENILTAARHSADLTSQLLAFSRKGKVVASVTDVHKIIEEVMRILERTIDKKIIIKAELLCEKTLINCDPSQMQNALLNIALNARDAMPDGGELCFRTRRILMDDDFIVDKGFEVKNGEYLEVYISDTGKGMSPEVRKHLFEPFFTTKAKGKGTGMGLAAVYGIVKNHKGAISVYSEVGRGSAFKLYFPVAGAAEHGKAGGSVERSCSLTGKLKILFVDDEKGVGEAAMHMLKMMGHDVELKRSGKEALLYYRDNFSRVDLVFLDMIMPEMNGKEVFEEMKRIHAGVIAVLSSGYSMNGDAQLAMDSGIKGFIQKPFLCEELEQVIVKVMRPG